MHLKVAFSLISSLAGSIYLWPKQKHKAENIPELWATQWCMHIVHIGSLGGLVKIDHFKLKGVPCLLPKDHQGKDTSPLDPAKDQAATENVVFSLDYVFVSIPGCQVEGSGGGGIQTVVPSLSF